MSEGPFLTQPWKTNQPPKTSAGQNARHSCALCERCFNRIDSLKRHQRTHTARHQQEKTRRRSCSACVRSKTKCNGQYPRCSRCEHKRLSCLYTTDRSELRQHDAVIQHHNRVAGFQLEFISQQDTSQDTRRTTQLENIRNAANSALDMEYSDRDVPLADEVAEVRPLADLQELSPLYELWPEAALSHFIGVGDFYPSTLNYYGEEAFVDSSFGVPADLMATNGPIRHLVPSQSCEDTFQDLTNSASAYDVSLANPVPVRHHDVSTDMRQGFHFHAAGTRAENAALEFLLGELTLARTAQDDEQDLDHRLVPPVDSLHHHHMDYPNKFSLPVTNAVTHVKLLKCLRLPLLRSPWQSMTLTAFPSKEQLDHFIDLYFCHFDMLLPMIHRPTYDPNQDLVLTLSMCAIGVLYSGLDEAMPLAESLSELLRRLLIYLSEQNSTAGRSYSSLTAQVLRAILGNSSGSRRLFDFGDDNRGRIVATARAMGLFARAKPDATSQNLRAQEQWETWVQKERMCRLAWSIHNVDTTATYYRNCRPHLSLAELQMDLPCSKDLWEAETAHAWVALSPWAHDSTLSKASMQKTLANLLQYSESPLASRSQANVPAIIKVSDDFTRTVMSTTLLRMVWDHRETLYSSSLISPRIAAVLQPTSSQQLDVLLSGLRSLAAMPLQSSGLNTTQFNIRGVGNETGSKYAIFHEEQHFRDAILRIRISLVAQIIATDRISAHMDTEYPHGVTVTKNDIYQVAERNLRSWATEKPSEPRRMARVGAQLLAISRLYPFHLPREPYDIFRAGLLLWTMVPLLQQVEGLSERNQSITEVMPTQRHKRVCQLDWLGYDDTVEAQIIDKWIEHGGNDYVLHIYGIPDICNQEGRRQILCNTSDLLRKQHVWGASESYRQIIQRALQEHPR